MSLNNYRYLVTSNLAGVVPSLNSMTAVVQIPLNVERLMAMAMRAGAQPQSSITLGIAQRPVLQNPGGATGGLQSPRSKRQAGNTTAGGPPPANGSGNTAGNGAGTAVGNVPAVAPPPAGGNTPPPPTPPQTGQNPPSNAGPAIPAASQLLLAQTFSPVNAQILLDRENARIAVPISQIDGEFILTMTVAGTPVGAQPQPVPQQGQPQQGQPQPAPQPAPQTAPQPAPQQGQPQQGGGLVQPAPPQPGGIIATQPGPAPVKTANNQPRQEAAAPVSPGAFEMKMADLMTMAETRRNGGMMPTWELMTKLAASQKKAVQKGSETPRRNSLLMRRRLGAHF